MNRSSVREFLINNYCYYIDKYTEYLSRYVETGDRIYLGCAKAYAGEADYWYKEYKRGIYD